MNCWLRVYMGRPKTTMRLLIALFGKWVTKDDFVVGRDTLEMGVCSAVIHFNDDVNGMEHVFNSLSLRPEKNYITYRTHSLKRPYVQKSDFFAIVYIWVDLNFL